MAKPIKIEIKGDASGAQKAFGKVEKGLGGLGGPIAKMAGLMAGAFALGKIVDFGAELFSLGSDLELQSRKISTVFGDNETGVRAWADSVNEAFGMTETGVANMAAQTADLLKPIGFTSEAAAALSTEIVGLSPALAEWSGGTHDAAMVSEILNKALLGETEGLKALGISINGADKATRALEIAQRDGRTEVTAMDEALAIQELVLEKSTDAQDAYTGGTDTLAGKQAFLKSKIAEVKEYLATKLMPVFATVTQWVIDELVPALGRFADRMRDLWAEHGPKVTEIMTTIKDAIMDAVDWIRDNEYVMQALGITVGVLLVGAFASLAISVIAALAPFILVAAAIAALTAGVLWAYKNVGWFRTTMDFLGGKIKEVAGWVRDNFVPGLRVLGDFITGTVVPKVKGFATEVGKWIGVVARVVISVKDKIGEIFDKVKTVVTTVGTKMSEITEKIKAPFRTAIQWVKDKWQELKDTVTRAISIPNPFGFLGGGGGGARALGGTVGSSGGYRVGERGPETIFLPAGASVASSVERGSAGNASTINVNVQSNANAHMIASELAWVLRTTGRG